MEIGHMTCKALFTLRFVNPPQMDAIYNRTVHSSPIDSLCEKSIRFFCLMPAYRIAQSTALIHTANKKNSAVYRPNGDQITLFWLWGEWELRIHLMYVLWKLPMYTNVIERMVYMCSHFAVWTLVHKSHPYNWYINNAARHVPVCT